MNNQWIISRLINDESSRCWWSSSSHAAQPLKNHSQWVQVWLKCAVQGHPCVSPGYRWKHCLLKLHPDLSVEDDPPNCQTLRLSLFLSLLGFYPPVLSSHLRRPSILALLHPPTPITPRELLPKCFRETEWKVGQLCSRFHQHEANSFCWATHPGRPSDYS